LTSAILALRTFIVPQYSDEGENVKVKILAYSIALVVSYA